MLRFKTTLDSVKRTLTILNIESQFKLTITHLCSDGYMNKILDNECTDDLVEFANDLGGNLENSLLALELYGDSEITFTDNNWPELSGGVYLDKCKLHNPSIRDSTLRSVNVSNAESFIVSNSTIEVLAWEHREKLHISHCFINERYNIVTKHMSPNSNEWFMNQPVAETLW